MSLLVRLAALGLLILSSVVPVAAGQPRGSAGWTTDGWTTFSGVLYSGPGTVYDETGNIDAGVRVRVDRCTHRWCQIHTASLHGWITQDNVSFGQQPGGLLVGRAFPTERGGSGQVCFYEGPHFTGSAICASSGRVVHDLALLHHDNTISSIEIGDGVSAIVCRDRGFRSYCKVIDVNAENLEGFLDNSISSLRVY